ncbi:MULTISPECIES: efflux RND transporter periplasmic adaptor subunit [unclassified Pseudoalteromonas]|uniref:efflux RND transporter periplasmic adaptor subunit n=1 Tax=unclassified Pseudoalteromonas TaxID=194690 RepID=UPI0005AA8E29|nr:MULTISPECIES: efflux RND transporter periplasmic adaptor subunit [unclassified Pseudoalteromonas]
MRNIVYIQLFLLFTSLGLKAQAEPLNVEVVYSKQEIKNYEISLSGNVEALNNAQLTILEEGIVKSIKVDAGDAVVKGQTLIELDDTLAKIQLAQAKSTLDSAKIQYQENVRLLNEIQALAQKQVIAETLLSERKANLALSKALMTQEQAKVDLQKEILKRHALTAPFSGVIAQRNIDVGEWIAQQDPTFQLVSNDSLRIFINIPQEYFNKIKTSTAVNASVIPDTSPTDIIQLNLSQFVTVSNPISRTFQARIDLPKNTQLVPGMSAKVKLSLSGQQATQVTLPKTALKRHPDDSYSVYSVIDNKIKRLAVQLVQTNFDQVTLLGVPDHAAIIVSGSELLVDGTSVSIKDNKGVL